MSMLFGLSEEVREKTCWDDEENGTLKRREFKKCKIYVKARKPSYNCNERAFI